MLEFNTSYYLVSKEVTIDDVLSELANKDGVWVHAPELETKEFYAFKQVDLYGLR